jgi:hypothetical protein
MEVSPSRLPSVTSDASRSSCDAVNDRGIELEKQLIPSMMGTAVRPPMATGKSQSWHR